MGDTATFGVDLGGTQPAGRVGRSRRHDRRAAPVPRRPARSTRSSTPSPARCAAFAPAAARRPARSESARPGMVDHDGVIHYSPNVPAFLQAPVRARLEAVVGLPTSSTTTPTSRSWPSSPTARRTDAREVLLITLGTGRRWRHRHPGPTCCAARTASVPRSGTSRSIPTVRSARAASGVTGRRSRRGPRSVRMGRESVAAGRAPVGARSGRVATGRRSRASTSATPPQAGDPRRDRARRGVRRVRGRRARRVW